MMRSARLTYRRPVQADRENLHALDNDPAVMRWVNGGLSISLDRFDVEIMPTYLKVETEWAGFWIIEAGEDFLGWISLRRTENLDVWSLGYRLIQKAWGRGYATEAAAFFVGQAANQPEVSRVSATTYEKNVGSRRVLEKSGFKLVKRFRLKDTQSDTSIQAGEAWDGDDLLYECLVVRR
ncbi:MAG: GNAT family N-acetyltransferase [Pseudomonadales bacterium]|nr:GNAT family N-acetyltransferase [Pseudomonadales bacterium]